MDRAEVTHVRRRNAHLRVVTVLLVRVALPQVRRLHEIDHSHEVGHEDHHPAQYADQHRLFARVVQRHLLTKLPDPRLHLLLVEKHSLVMLWRSIVTCDEPFPALRTAGRKSLRLRTFPRSASKLWISTESTLRSSDGGGRHRLLPVAGDDQPPEHDERSRVPRRLRPQPHVPGPAVCERRVRRPHTAAGRIHERRRCGDRGDRHAQHKWHRSPAGVCGAGLGRRRRRLRAGPLVVYVGPDQRAGVIKIYTPRKYGHPGVPIFT